MCALFGRPAAQTWSAICSGSVRPGHPGLAQCSLTVRVYADSEFRRAAILSHADK